MQNTHFLSMAIDTSLDQLVLTRFSGESPVVDKKCQQRNFKNQGIGSILASDTTRHFGEHSVILGFDYMKVQMNTHNAGMTDCLTIDHCQKDCTSQLSIYHRWGQMHFNASSKQSMICIDDQMKPATQSGEPPERFPADTVRATCARVHFNDWVRIDIFDPDSCAQQVRSEGGGDWSHPMKTLPFTENLPKREIPSYLQRRTAGSVISWVVRAICHAALYAGWWTVCSASERIYGTRSRKGR